MSFAVRDDGILLHIGPHKTGTTAVQASFAAARDHLLRKHGILYPGQGQSQTMEAAAAIGRGLGWDHIRPDRRRWHDLRDEVTAHRGRVVLSSEVFCEASPEVVRSLVDQLGRDRVQVAITLRPLERLLSSSWQQYIKSGYRLPYEKWLRAVLPSRTDAPTTTPSFWIRNDHGALVRRWSDAVGAHNVVLVVVDSGDPRCLFDAFEDMLGVPRATLDLAGPRNRSLSAPEVELLRQFNRLAYKKIPAEDYVHLVKRGAVRGLLESRTPDPDEPQLVTPAWAIEKARDYARSDVEQIDRLGVPVIGNLAALVPDDPIADDLPVPVVSVPTELGAQFMFSLVQASTHYERPGLRQRVVRRLTRLARRRPSFGRGSAAAD